MDPLALVLDRQPRGAGRPGPFAGDRSRLAGRDGPVRTPTERQGQILRALRGWIAETGEAPSVRELVAQVGLSSTSFVAYQSGPLGEGGVEIFSRSGPCSRW